MFVLPALYAKALHYKETLCKTSEVQRFLNTLVSKPPEVGHYVSCSHPAKSGPDPKTNATRKVVTFSAIENFGYANWRDFSDPRLIDPSDIYPIIEINVSWRLILGEHFKEHFLSNLRRESCTSTTVQWLATPETCSLLQINLLLRVHLVQLDPALRGGLWQD